MFFANNSVKYLDDIHHVLITLRELQKTLRLNLTQRKRRVTLRTQR